MNSSVTPNSFRTELNHVLLILHKRCRPHSAVDYCITILFQCLFLCEGGVGCHLDRHENIGKGQIGLEGFRRIMAEPRFDGIPMILETPAANYASEIKILNKLT